MILTKRFVAALHDLGVQLHARMHFDDLGILFFEGEDQVELLLFEFLSGTKREVLDTPVFWAANEATKIGELIIIDNAYTHPLLNLAPRWVTNRFGSCVGFPLKNASSKLVGSVALARNNTHRWSNEEVSQVEEFSKAVFHSL